jgi:hypothetical protein
MTLKRVKALGRTRYYVEEDKYEDLSGRVFGLLTVLGLHYIKQNKQHPSVFWLCQCACGGKISALAPRLKKGGTSSCGCVEKLSTRGCSNDKIYTIWQGIKSRCLCPSDDSYTTYGGAGITICEEWKQDFGAFLKDMGYPPCDGNAYSIDRIDNEVGYCKENCRWATNQQQSHNKKKSPRNTSGITGVSLNRVNNCWVAHWTDLSGKLHRKSFAVKKYGYEEAFRLACEARQAAIAELNAQGAGYTEWHGK